jgi:DNA repair exonuclease SbcCD ATPase subunit
MFPALLVSGQSHAQEGASAQKALAKAQFMLRQVSAEKSTLQQQVADLQKQVEALNKQLGDAKSAASSRQQTLSRQMNANAQKWQASNDKLTNDLQSTSGKLKEAARQSAQLQQQLQTERDNFSLCRTNNRKLYDINRELLDKYRDKGAMDALLQREPFTGVSSVEVENLIQDTQYRIDDLKLPEQQGGTDNMTQQTSQTDSLSGSGATGSP